jgi:hypothetical protein
MMKGIVQATGDSVARLSSSTVVEQTSLQKRFWLA